MAIGQVIGKISAGTRLKAAEVRGCAVELAEIDPVALCEQWPIDDVYGLLLELAKVGGKDLGGTLERFLAVEDAEMASLVLETLCVRWGLTGDYLAQVERFVRGVSWDSEGDVRQVAIRVVGEHLSDLTRAKKSKLNAQEKRSVEALVGELLDTFTAEGSVGRDVRQTAYLALCRACGKQWEELPSEYARLDLSQGSKDVDWGVIQQANEWRS